MCRYTTSTTTSSSTPSGSCNTTASSAIERMQPAEETCYTERMKVETFRRLRFLGLFAIGVVGVLVRRNAIVMFMSVELMLNAANLAFIAFARARLALSGQVFVLFVIAVAAAEVAVGLALLVSIFRSRQSIDVDRVSNLRG